MSVIGNLTVFFKLDSTQARKDMEKMENAIRSTAQSLSRVGRSMTTFVTLPIAALGKTLATTNFQFDQSMNRVRALTGITDAGGAAFAVMEKQARRLGATTRFSASEAASAMAFLAQTGFQVQEIYQALPGVLDLAAAANEDLGVTADVASNILRAFELDASQMGRVGDILTQVFTNTNVTLFQLSEAMKLVAPTAKIAGISLEETATAIGFLGDAGLQGTIAGTSLNQALLKLTKPSGEARKLIAALNLEFERIPGTGKLKSLADIMAELEGQTLTTSNIVTIFGIRGGRAIATLIGSGEHLRKFTAEMMDLQDVAKTIANVQIEGLVGAFLKLRSVWEEAQLQFSKASGFKELLGTLADAARVLLLRFTGMSDATQAFIGKMILLAALTGPVALGLSAIVTSLGLTAVLLKALIPLISGMGIAFVSGVGLWVAVLGGSVLALMKLHGWLKDTAKQAEDFGEEMDEAKQKADLKDVLSDKAVNKLQIDQLIPALANVADRIAKAREEINRLSAAYLKLSLMQEVPGLLREIAEALGFATPNRSAALDTTLDQLEKMVGLLSELDVRGKAIEDVLAGFGHPEITLEKANAMLDMVLKAEKAGKGDLFGLVEAQEAMQVLEDLMQAHAFVDNAKALAKILGEPFDEAKARAEGYAKFLKDMEKINLEGMSPFQRGRFMEFIKEAQRLGTTPGGLGAFQKEVIDPLNDAAARLDLTPMTREFETALDAAREFLIEHRIVGDDAERALMAFEDAWKGFSVKQDTQRVAEELKAFRIEMQNELRLMDIQDPIEKRRQQLKDATEEQLRLNELTSDQALAKMAAIDAGMDAIAAKSNRVALDLTSAFIGAFEEIVTGFLRGTRSIEDVTQVLADAMTGTFLNMFSDILKQKIKFDKIIKDNFSGLADIGTSLLGLFGGGTAQSSAGRVPSNAPSPGTTGVLPGGGLIATAAHGGITRGATRLIAGDNPSGVEALIPLERFSELFGARNSAGAARQEVNVQVFSPNPLESQTERDDSGVKLIQLMFAANRSGVAADISRGGGEIDAALQRTYGIRRRSGA